MENRKIKLTTVLVLLAGFALLPIADAVIPAPDGGYPGGNTAEGQNALFSLTTGGYNTAVGFFSLRSNAINSLNTAIGAGALFANAGDPTLGQGEQNTATGAAALLSNTSGESNTANGAFALFSNTTGGNDTAIGYQALYSNTTGDFNTAIGAVALGRNTTGGDDIALGNGAGLDVFTADNVICIGHPGEDVSNTTWISNVYGVTTQNGMTAPVIVSIGGQLGTVASSERFKKDIVAMDKASEAILSLRPVAFQYKADIGNTPQFGLIAEEVAKVNPALVLPDKKGKPYTVRYDAVNAMLLNEFLKEHRQVQEQKAIVAHLKREFQSQLAMQHAQIQQLTAGLQKVSAQLAAVSSPGRQPALSKFARGQIRPEGAEQYAVLNDR